MEHIGFFNISGNHFFGSVQYEYIDIEENIEDLDESQDLIELPDEVQNDIQGNLIDDTEVFDDIQEELIDDTAIIDIPEFPIENTDSIITRISVILAQLVIPLNITSSIDLPQEAFEIKDVNKKLKLKECILLQPTNVLFVKGFINNSVEYSKMDPLNSEKSCDIGTHYTVDIPFECSTAVNFFRQPLDLISNTKEVFKYSGRDVPGLNQVSQEFFNEIPFGKLLSSKIVESVQFIKPKDSQEGFIRVEENMVIELRMEILQSQSIIIPIPGNNYNHI